MTRRAKGGTDDDPEWIEFRAGIGRRVRDARRRIGITQDELAEAAGLSKSYVFSVETRGANVTSETLWLFGRTLGVGVRDLLPETERDQAAPPAIHELAQEVGRLTAGVAAHGAGHARLHADVRVLEAALKALVARMDRAAGPPGDDAS